jgi:uncharacterized membrane protein
MNGTTLVLRIVHVCGAIFWGGGALMMEFFIRPAILASAEGGQQVARHLANRARLHIFMMIAGVATLMSGTLLYWRDSDGFSSAWMRSSAGIGFGVGAAFGILAFISGAIFGNANTQLGRIGVQVQGKPTAEQLAKIQTLQNRITRVTPIHVASVILAMLFMATARYLSF